MTKAVYTAGKGSRGGDERREMKRNYSPKIACAPSEKLFEAAAAWFTQRYNLLSCGYYVLTSSCASGIRHNELLCENRLYAIRCMYLVSVYIDSRQHTYTAPFNSMQEIQTKIRGVYNFELFRDSARPLSVHISYKYRFAEEEKLWGGDSHICQVSVHVWNTYTFEPRRL